jgi:soluble lytic murein transglycosylase-like protein
MLLFLLLSCGAAVEPAPITEVGECIPEPWVQGCTRPNPEGLGFLIEEAAAEVDIDPAWLAITVWRESGCDSAARGAAGEIGLTQINPKVWSAVIGASPDGWEMWDPQSNLRYSAMILRRLRDSSASEREMFRKYNGKGAKARKYAAEQMAVLAKL